MRFITKINAVAAFLALATISVVNAQTPPAGFSATFSGLVYDRATGTFNSVLTLKNTGSTAVLSPLTIEISTGTPSVTVTGSSDGTTYLARFPTGLINPGAAVQVTVAFSDPKRIAFVPRVASVLTTGVAAQATIARAQGGTITVFGNSPISGTEVSIPAGALGDPSDTITIGYSNVLPGALNPVAVAAGISPVAAVVTLSKSGSTPFNAPVTVTVPYSLSAAGPRDYPVVAYWDSSIQRYQPVQVLSVDQTAGTVTFVTKHFSWYIVTALKGLVAMLTAETPFATPLAHLSIGFNPATDEFEAQNFTTSYPGASEGSGAVCYGLTSFAQWYFAYEKSSAGGLYQKYSATSDAGVTHLPQEDALARELITQTFADTFADNSNPIFSYLAPPLQTASYFILELALTDTPQLASALSINPPGSHSIMIYSWDLNPDGVAGTFGVYDPNGPYPITEPSLVFSDAGTFEPWTGADGETRNVIISDALSSHYDPATLANLYGRFTPGTTSGPFFFNTLSVQSPLPGASLTQSAYPNSEGTLPVDSQSGTPLAFSWICDPCLAAEGGNAVQYYLHTYQAINGQLTPLALMPATSGGTVRVTTKPFAGNSSELIAFVSSFVGATGTNCSPDNPPTLLSDCQEDISNHYGGFIRVDLVPPGPTGPMQGTMSLTGAESNSECTWNYTIPLALSVTFDDSGLPSASLIGTEIGVPAGNPIPYGCGSYIQGGTIQADAQLSPAAGGFTGSLSPYGTNLTINLQLTVGAAVTGTLTAVSNNNAVAATFATIPFTLGPSPTCAPLQGNTSCSVQIYALTGAYQTPDNVPYTQSTTTKTNGTVTSQQTQSLSGTFGADANISGIAENPLAQSVTACDVDGQWINANSYSWSNSYTNPSPQPPYTSDQQQITGSESVNNQVFHFSTTFTHTTTGTNEPIYGIYNCTPLAPCESVTSEVTTQTQSFSADLSSGLVAYGGSYDDLQSGIVSLLSGGAVQTSQSTDTSYHADASWQNSFLFGLLPSSVSIAAGQPLPLACFVPLIRS